MAETSLYEGLKRGLRNAKDYTDKKTGELREHLSDLEDGAEGTITGRLSESIAEIIEVGNAISDSEFVDITAGAEIVTELKDGILTIQTPDTFTGKGIVVYSKKRFSGNITFYLEPIGEAVAIIQSLDSEARWKDKNGIQNSVKLEYSENNTVLRKDGIEVSDSYLAIKMFINASIKGRLLRFRIGASSNFSTGNLRNHYIGKLPQKVYRDTLYFSENGDDSNNGLSPANPKKNPEDYILSGNCDVMLKSGDVFHTNLICGSNLKLSTYGGVERAVISGLRHADDVLSKTSSNVYEVYLGVDDIGIIIINNHDYWKRVETEQISKESEYFYNRQNKTLYIYSTMQLDGVSIEYSVAELGIYVPYKSHQVIIDGVEVEYFGKLGIDIANGTNNVVVSNCKVSNIGNAFLESSRYGNGIQVWMQNVHDIIIKNNIVTNCFDAGITPQVSSNTSAHTINSENVRFEHNYVSNCFYPIECFLHQTSKAIRNTHISNNYVEKCVDITNGYRGNANHSFGALLMLWTINGAEENEVFVENNICIGSDSFAIAFYDSTIAEEHDSGSQYILKNNVLVTSLNQRTPYYIGNDGKQIKNEEAYHGDDVFIVLSDVLDFNDKANVAYYSTIGQKLII